MKPYAFSGWIANLGVVPLFSFAFFLLAPAFFLFNFLRILVCVVLEDIFLSLSYQFNKQYRAIFLTCFTLLVKGFITQSYAGPSIKSIQKDIFLAKGEQIELNIKDLENFSIGNNEVIQCKYLKNKEKFLVKAKMLGFSDLIIKSNENINFHVYVTSKQSQLKKMEIAHALKDTNLEVMSNERLIHITGEVQDLNTYFVLKNLHEKPAKEQQLSATLTQDLKNHIIADLYRSFYKENGEYILCSPIGIEMNCHYKSKQDLSLFFQRMKKKYLVHFNSSIDIYASENFKVKFFIILEEMSEISLRNSGVNRIQADIAPLISENHLTLKTGEILFSDENQFVKVLARPEILTLPENAFSIELGADIPFQIQTNTTSSINWKFAGLKLEGNLKLTDKSMILESKSQLTQGTSESISGPKTKSIVKVPLGTSFQLANISIKQGHKDHKKIPVLGDIPILKSLFSERNIKDSIKTIKIYAHISQREL